MNLSYTEFEDKPGIVNLLKRFLGYKIRYFGGTIMVAGDKLQRSGKTKHIKIFDLDKYAKNKGWQ